MHYNVHVFNAARNLSAYLKIAVCMAILKFLCGSQKISKTINVKLTKIKRHTLHCVLHGMESTCVFYDSQEVSFSRSVAMGSS